MVTDIPSNSSEARLAKAIQDGKPDEIEKTLAEIRDQIIHRVVSRLELDETRANTIAAYLATRDADFAARQELAIAHSVAKMDDERRKLQSSRLTAFVTLAGVGFAGVVGFAWTSIQSSVQTQVTNALNRVETALDTAGGKAESIAQAGADKAVIEAQNIANGLRSEIGLTSKLVEDALANALEAQNSTALAQARAESAQSRAEEFQRQSNAALDQTQAILATIEANRKTLEAIESAEQARDLVRQALEDDDMLALFNGRMQRYVTPAGAVIAFDRTRSSECPGGWTLFEPALGRMVIGAGARADDALSEYPSFGDDREAAIGGEETVGLEVNEMPRHRHQEKGSKRLNVADTSGPRIHVQDVSNTSYDEIYTSYEGEAKPHNNMPPYIALYFCKKD